VTGSTRAKKTPRSKKLNKGVCGATGIADVPKWMGGTSEWYEWEEGQASLTHLAIKAPHWPF